MQSDAIDVGPGLRPIAGIQANAISAYVLFMPIPGVDLDKAVINAESNTTIREIAKFLNHYTGIKIAVIGHTDATGTYKHNMKLSKARADAVVAMLTKKLGVKKSQVFAAGVGWLSPIATSNTDEGRALNRRVELIRVKKGGQ